MNGQLLIGEKLKRFKGSVVAIAQGKKALSRRINTSLCAMVCPRVPRQTTNRKIDVVIGGTCLLEGVTIVYREYLKDLQVPDSVNMLLINFKEYEFIVLKNRDGDLVWAQDLHVTLRKDFGSKSDRHL